MQTPDELDARALKARVDQLTREREAHAEGWLKEMELRATVIGERDELRAYVARLELAARVISRTLLADPDATFEQDYANSELLKALDSAPAAAKTKEGT